ncbi:hypothetical protein C8R44DRAFT_884308 [Mycena epipterygia]|nr:hypothetical protein C8R44DRAFT_884308 [Mycena epipterygia]
MTGTGEKRKRPPTFQHFPINRAKILKQAWVQNTKLKSKWKAEKRKSSLGVPVPPLNEEEDEADAAEDKTVEAEDKAAETETASQVRAPTRAPPTRGPPPKKRARRTQPDPKEAESSDAPTLRDRRGNAEGKLGLQAAANQT